MTPIGLDPDYTQPTTRRQPPLTDGPSHCCTQLPLLPITFLSTPINNDSIHNEEKNTAAVSIIITTIVVPMR